MPEHDPGPVACRMGRGSRYWMTQWGSVTQGVTVMVAVPVAVTAALPSLEVAVMVTL